MAHHGYLDPTILPARYLSLHCPNPKGKGERGKGTDFEEQRSTVIYDNPITIRNIPEAAWDYIVNGKAALDWVMERQSVRTDKDSGITNDANDWSNETMHNPRYPLGLFQRIITVSLETQKIVQRLPALEI